MREGQKEVVGEVVGTTVYPFKSMKGIDMPFIALRSVSVVGDRRYAYEVLGSHRSSMLLDSTQMPELVTYSTRFVNPNDPKESPVVVTVPDENEYLADSPELLNEVTQKFNKRLKKPQELVLVGIGRGLYHSKDVSLLSVGSVDKIGDWVRESVDLRRFRENLIIRTYSGLPFEEDRWIGNVMRFGETEDRAILIVLKLDTRCATVTYDPETAALSPEIHRVIAQKHNNTLGVYCSIAREGLIFPNDKIYLSSLF